MSNIESHSPAFIWNGFYFRWNNYPHRLSILGSRIRHSIQEHNKQLLYTQHELSLKIGNFPPEKASYFVPYTAIATDDIMMGVGHSTPHQLCSKIGEEAHATQTIRVKLSELTFVKNLSGLNKQNVAVLLNGFHLTSVNNQSGWHFGGLGISLGEVKWVGDDTFEFDAQLFARPSRGPELLTHGNKKWNYKQDCIYELSFDFKVVSGDKEEVNFVSQNVGQSQLDEHTTFHHNNVVEISGEANKYEQALTGLRGFKFELNIHDKAWFKKRTGRYMRDLGVHTKEMTYDAVTGKGKVDLHLNYSNKGDTVINFANKWKMNTAVNLCMVQLNGAAKIEQKYIQGEAASRRRGDKKFLRLYLD